MKKNGEREIEYSLALFLTALALLLLALAPVQTKWIDGLRFAAQPRLLPVVSLLAIGSFLAPMAVRGFAAAVDKRELITWLRPAEYLLYFLLYVQAVQHLGYGFATIAFCPLLAWRAGCGARQCAVAALTGLVIVLFFKGALSVKIPGAAWYEHLPAAVRTHFILYF